MKAEKAAKADGPAFLNVLDRLPARLGPRAPAPPREVLNLAVEAASGRSTRSSDGRYWL